MRTIERSTRFKKDYKREKKGQLGAKLDDLVQPVLLSLVNDEPLPPRCQDHGLVGEWQGYRDCHIRPDLVLIYRKPDDDVLELVRLGSHAELSL